MPANMAKWSFMREWWRVLQLSDLLEVSTKSLRGSQQCAYGAMTLLEPTPGRRAKGLWVQQRDALELVFLQLKADKHAFMEMAREFCLCEEGTEAVWGGFHADEFVPCLTELRLSDQHVEDGDDPAAWALWLLSTLMEPVPLSSRSKRFCTSRKKILSLVDASMRVVCERRFTIPVTIGVWFSDVGVATAVLDSVNKLKLAMDEVLVTPVDDAKEEERRAALRVYPFRIASLDLTIDKMPVTSTLQSTLDQVAVMSGLQLRKFIYSSAQKLSKQAFGNFLRTVMVGPASSPVDAELQLSHKLTKPRIATLTATQLVQIFSCLLEPTRFTSMCIVDMMDHYSPIERHRVWLWLIHALFSSSAVHSISYFQLHIKHLTDEDIGVSCEYLRSTNPVALLCHPTWRFVGIADPESQPPKCVSLTKGTTLLLNPCRGRDREPVLLPVSGWHDVIQEDIELVDVVVPGYGQCRVKKSEVVDWQVLPIVEPQSRFQTHSVESLKIWIHRSYSEFSELGDDGSAKLMDFVELVGQPVISLDVWCRVRHPDDFLDSIWASCPNLQGFRAHRVDMRRLTYLVEAYEMERCRVPSLQFTHCPTQNGMSIAEFTEALSDPTMKITQVLRELTLGENPQIFFFTEEDFPDFANMLGKNTTLRYFALHMEPLLQPKFAHLFTPYHGQVLEGVSQRLPVECKCAFLSVVNQANDPEKATTIPSAPLIARFDSSILSSIFEFCGTPVIRTAMLKDY